MKITKFGHSTILVEAGKTRIIFDPGKFGPGASGAKNIAAVIVTHGHFDHVDPELLKKILKNNPAAKIFTNSEVGAMLAAAGIAFTKVEEGDSAAVDDLTIEGFGNEHIIFGEGRGKCQNTGYLIAGKFFYPGDAYVIPTKPVTVLALPVGGPWLTVPDAMDYVTKIAPVACVPIHDGFNSEAAEIAKLIAEKTKTKFIPLPIGAEVVVDTNP